MASTLKQVLTAFENHNSAMSVRGLAHQLNVEPSALVGMLDYWVRKGKLREVGADNCGTCGTKSGCPFVMAMPRQYEPVTTETPVSVTACGCGGGCKT